MSCSVDPENDPVGRIIDRISESILAATWPSGWPITNDKDYARHLAEQIYDDAWEFDPGVPGLWGQQ